MVKKSQEQTKLKPSSLSPELRIAALESRIAEIEKECSDRIKAYDAKFYKSEKEKFDLEAENASLKAKIKVRDEELEKLGKLPPTREQIISRIKGMADENPSLITDIIKEITRS